MRDYLGINRVGIKQLTNPYFEARFRYIVTEYEHPKPPRICLFLPCSVIKPYFNSPIHKVINKTIAQYEDHIHKIVISNAGIIPYEFAGYYPFNSYDWNTHIDVNIKDCDTKLSDTSDIDLALIIDYNLGKLKNTIENTNMDTKHDWRNNMPRKVHYQTEIKLDIQSDMIKDAQSSISTILEKVWPDTYFAELDPKDYIDIVVDLWIKYYIDSSSTKEAISKIKYANPPSSIKIYLVFNLFDDEDSLLIDYSEIRKEPLFRAYLTTKDLWDTYSYDTQTKKFESLEIIEPAYVEEIKQGMSEKEKTDLDETILQAYGFHNKLLEITTKKILLYTAQPPKVVEGWNKTGIIFKGIYFTDKMSRAEYYWQEGDIIVDYHLPEDKLVMTSEFAGAKEYVTISDVII